MDIKRIDELATGLEWYLKQLSGLISGLHEAKYELKQLREAYDRSQNYEFQQLRQQVSALTEALKNQGVVLPSQYELDFTQIKVLLEGGWPQAVFDDRICSSEAKQIERANGIINLFVSEYLKDKRFLDFGCGEGHCVAAAQKNEAAFVIGYDIKPQWKVYDNLTDDWALVEANAPYDIILAHDVLDHIEHYDPIEALKKMKSVLSPDGHIYVRNHPWSSRHGGHVYLRKNLAFLHLVLDDVELMRIGGLESSYNIKVRTPLETYPYWFEQAGLTIDSELSLKTPVEDFFKNSACLYNRIIKQWDEGQDPFIHMQIDFVDYVLSSTVKSSDILM